MITCQKCSKENQDHYKFCLGCGAELPRDAAPKPFAAPTKTPPHGMKLAPVAAPPVAAPPVAAPPVAAPPPQPLTRPIPAQTAPLAPSVTDGPPPVAPGPAPAAVPAGPCPQCATPNPAGNVFCATCGFRLGGAAPPPPRSVSSAAVATGGAGAVVFTALRADGSEAGTYALPNLPEITLGRDTGGIFAGDSYLSPRHAHFTSKGPGKLAVKDVGSLNGVYKKLQRDVPMELRPSDVFRIGQEIIRYESIDPLPATPDGVERLGAPSKGYVGRISLVIGRDTSGNAYPVPESGIHIGRERGDVLFPEDGYVSGLHCRLSYENGHLFLTDLGSSNGTFLRIRTQVDLQSGDVLLMGQQLFRIAM